MTALDPRSPQPGRVDAVGATTRAVGSAVALLALTVGVPVLLLRFGRWPITGIPSWSQIRELPTTVVSDEAIPTALAVVPWATWALFVACVVAEGVAQVRGRGRAAPRLGGPLQRAAASLVGSVVMSVGPIATSAGAAPLSLPTAPTAASTVVGRTATSAPPAALAITGLDRGTGAAPEPALAAETRPTGPTITVRHGDSPWSLATTHLGDGTRWRQIWELNRGRPQPGGETWIDLEAPVQPGWQLVLPADAAGAMDAAGAGESDATSGPPAGELVVRPGDNFWRLAEAELADDWGRPPSDDEVADYWLTMVDGNRDSLLPPRDPNMIYPGQAVVVPGTPADPTPLPGRPEEVPAPSSPGVGTAPGVPDQDPETPDEDPEAPDQQPDSPDQDPEVPDQDEGEDGDDQGGGNGLAPTTEATGSSPDSGGTPPGARPQETESTSTERSDDSSDGRALPLGLIGGGVALAGVVVLLDRRRRAQQQHRRRGHRIAMPSAPHQQDEAVLRHGANVDGARLLEAALRTAAAGSGAAGLPPLRWVEVQGDAVLLVLSARSPAPPGFTSVGDERWITDRSLDELEALGARAEMPAPTLIPVGTTADGAEMLVELEGSAVVTIGGAPEPAAGLLRAIAVAAATSPWSEQSRVLLVGLEGEALDLPSVTTTESLADALTEAEAQVDRIMSALWTMRCQSTGQARTSGVTPEAWAPLVVMSAVPPREVSERQRLATLAARPRSGVAFVTLSASDAAPVGRAMTIGEDGWLHIDGVDVEIRPDRVDEADSGVLTELLDVAARYDDVDRDAAADPPVRRPPAEVPAADDSPPDPHEGTHAGVEDAPDTDADTAPGTGSRRLTDLMAGVDVVVRVLGEVEAVRLADRPTGERLVPVRQKGLEALVYMALREAPVDREELESRLFPDGANAAKTVYNTISAARGLVGDDLFPAPTDGRYTLSDRVVTDYGVFCELVAQADETDDAAVAAKLLTDALSLVQTEPFMGVGRNYAWVGAHRGMIVAQVIDTAEELAEIHLARSDWRAAEWAARRGLRAFPADERMHRVLMRTAWAAGNIPGVHRAFRELCDAVADPDLGVEPEDTLHPETITLLEDLTSSTPRRGELGA